MGKFDGILLATDWDGTVYYDGKIPERNIEAVNYFKANGGKFTVCSGRYFNFLKDFQDQISSNTYTVCYNGALIIDIEKDDVLYRGFCDEHLESIIESLLNLNLGYRSINFYDTEHPTPIEYSIDECREHLKELCSKNIYKVLLKADSAEDALFGMHAVNELNLHDYIAVRSWNISLEILKKENAKGAALKRIAAAIGAKLIVAVGDYENDIDMLSAADIGYAVENACDTLKSVADRTTSHAKDGALADVIADIEQTLTQMQ